MILGTDVGGPFFYCVGQVLINELSFSPAADPENSGVIHRGTPGWESVIIMNIGHYVWCLLCRHCNCAFIFFVTGDRPTMCIWKKFPNKHGQDINICVQIGTNYQTFGTFLLEDNSGTIVSGIERAMMCDAERINEDILMKWIGGKGQHPLTWDTLVTCLLVTLKEYCSNVWNYQHFRVP